MVRLELRGLLEKLDLREYKGYRDLLGELVLQVQQEALEKRALKAFKGQ
jgi:hypothetical protein